MELLSGGPVRTAGGGNCYEEQSDEKGWQEGLFPGL